MAALVEALAAQWGLATPWRADDAVHAPEELTVRLDASKAALQLGWTPRLSVREAVGWVATWYRAFHRDGDARELCLQQIARHADLRHR